MATFSLVSSHDGENLLSATFSNNHLAMFYAVTEPPKPSNGSTMHLSRWAIKVVSPADQIARQIAHQLPVSHVHQNVLQTASPIKALGHPRKVWPALQTMYATLIYTTAVLQMKIGANHVPRRQWQLLQELSIKLELRLVAKHAYGWVSWVKIEQVAYCDKRIALLDEIGDDALVSGSCGCIDIM